MRQSRYRRTKPLRLRGHGHAWSSLQRTTLTLRVLAKSFGAFIGFVRVPTSRRHTSFEGKYGTAKRGGYVIVRDEADTEAKVVTIKDGDVKWDPEALAALKLPLEMIQNRYSSM